MLQIWQDSRFFSPASWPQDFISFGFTSKSSIHLNDFIFILFFSYPIK